MKIIGGLKEIAPLLIYCDQRLSDVNLKCTGCPFETACGVGEITDICEVTKEA